MVKYAIIVNVKKHNTTDNMDSALIKAINTTINNIHIHINTFILSIIFILSVKYYN